MEECDLLLRGNSSAPPNKQLSITFHRILVAANYFLGFIAGNVHFALKRYEKLAEQVIEYCRVNDIKLILAGPVSRPHTKPENYLAQTINRHMQNKYAGPDNIYIDLLGTRNENDESLFFNDGAHVNETGHRRIAKLILQRMHASLFCSKETIEYSAI